MRRRRFKNRLQPAEKSYEDSLSEFRLVLAVEGEFELSSTIYVSEQSVYGDSIWNWKDPSNMRLKLYERCQLKIDWNSLLYDLDLTNEIIDDLKKYAFFRYTNSRGVFNTRRDTYHPATVVSEVKIVSAFFSHLRKQLVVGDVSLVNTLSDIEVQDLRDCLSCYTREKSALKLILIKFGSTVFGKYLTGGRLKWNKHDIETLSWDTSKKGTHERVPDELYSFLSQSASDDVKRFLKALDVEIEDDNPTNTVLGEVKKDFCNFREILESYINHKERVKRDRDNGTCYRSWNLPKEKRHKYICLIDQARIAAQIIIIMYTGARGSELLSFETDCLKQKNDHWVLIGTVIKNKGQDIPI